MKVPEYFVLFSGDGEFSVEVQFKGEGFVQPRRATAQEIASIVDAQTGMFHPVLTFDEHPFEIQKYEIDLQKKTLLISTKSHG